MNPLTRLARVGRIASLITLVLAVPLVAQAAVRRDGAWPASEKKVSFEFDGKPSEGLSKLADEAGWSLVVSKGIAVGEHDVKIDVEDQPADAVLDALFTESDVVAVRNGTLLTIVPAHGTASAAAPNPTPAASSVATPPTVPPVPTVRGEDRNVLGSDLVVAKDEVVHTVTVTGGSAKIYGTVTGDLVVAGGSADIEGGGRVVGNATVFGGSLTVESGARVDGDVGIVGGVLRRKEGAIVAGKVVDGTQGHAGSTNIKVEDGNVSTHVSSTKHTVSSGKSRLAEAASSFGQSVTNMSLLFVLGCVLLALAAGRMERISLEVAARPMKSFAMGMATIFLGTIVLTAMCITLVGIPFALVVGLLAVLSVYAAVAAILATFGAAVAGHKWQSPYVHLLVGCLAYLVIGVIPVVGSLATFVLVMVALGSVVSTRAAGLLERRVARPELV